MRRSFEFEIQLACDPDLVWAQVLRPALFLHVAAPLVRFRPLDTENFPDIWHEGEYHSAMRLFGVLPLGGQAIVIELPEPQGETRILRDAGHSPLLQVWDHRIEVSPDRDGTLYVDRVTLDAGILTPIIALVVRLFFRHRHKRLRTLAKGGFTALAPQ